MTIYENIKYEEELKGMSDDELKNIKEGLHRILVLVDKEIKHREE